MFTNHKPGLLINVRQSARHVDCPHIICLTVALVEDIKKEFHYMLSSC